MSHSKKERERYNEHRDRAGKALGLNKNQYNALRRVAHGLHRADENFANGTTGGSPIYRGNKILNRYEEKDYNKDRAHHFSKAEALRKKLGGKSAIHFHHQSDPRGNTLYASKSKYKKGKHGYKDYNHPDSHAIY